MQRKRKLESLHAMVAAAEPESAGQRLESAGSFRSTSKSEEAKKYKQKEVTRTKSNQFLSERRSGKLSRDMQTS